MSELDVESLDFRAFSKVKVLRFCSVEKVFVEGGIGVSVVNECWNVFKDRWRVVQSREYSFSWKEGRGCYGPEESL